MHTNLSIQQVLLIKYYTNLSMGLGTIFVHTELIQQKAEYIALDFVRFAQQLVGRYVLHPPATFH